MNNMSNSENILYIKKEFDNNLDFVSSLVDTKGNFYQNGNYKMDNIKKTKIFKIIKLSAAITYP